MLIGIVVASIIAYLTALVTIREKQIYQQIVFLLIYIIGMTFIGEMDILLPIYFLVSFFSIVINMNKISYVSIVIYAFFGCYLIFGLLFQNTIATCVSFIAKYWQFIVFFIVIDSKVNLKVDVKIRQLQIALLVETLLGVYLLLTNSEVGDNGMIRLVSNSQPITGNIAVAVLPVSVYLYFKNKGNHRTETQIIFIELGFLFWIIMSGTRGYTLLYAITMLFVFYDYVFNNRKSGKNAIQNRFAIIAFVCWLLLLLVIIVPGFTDRISAILRVEDSTGIRSYENAAEWNFFWSAPWEVKLFGVGLGGTPGRYQAYVDAIMTQVAKGMWDQNSYLYEAGAPFHDFFANLTLNFGLIGIVIIGLVNFNIWNTTTRICCNNKLIKLTFHLYQLGFLLMNYFRWSTDCGISEIIIFTLVLKLIEREFDKQPKYRRKRKRTETLA